MNHPVLRSIFPALIAAALPACGGGGGDPATVTPTPPAPPPPAAAGFSFTLDSSKATLRQGQQASLGVLVQRNAGFTQAIQFSAEVLPSGATAAWIRA